MNLPLAFFERMKKILGEEFLSFSACYDDTFVSSKAFRVNSYKKPKKNGLEKYNPIPMPYGKNSFYYSGKPGSGLLHDAGAIYIQEPSAIFPTASLPDIEGALALDVCAAPGGKSGTIASLIGEKGFLVANEISLSRAKTLLSNVERLGLTNTAVTMFDSEELAELFPSLFDIVVVDAPCSGEGMFRKEPDALADWSEECVKGCAERSKAILLNASKCVKDGGYLLYSTCTFSEEENENNVFALLQTEDFDILPLPQKIINCTRKGIAEKDKKLELCRRFYPYTAMGEGQFCALLQKKKRKEDNIIDNSPTRKNKKDNKKILTKEEEKAVKEFFDKNLDITLPCYRLKEGIYVSHPKMPPLPDYKVLSPSVKVGEVEKGRLEPHHQFFSAYGNHFLRKVDFEEDDKNAFAYACGNEIEVDIPNGYGVITIEGCSLGGFKAVDGHLKNKYPKGLRKF